MSEDDDDMDIGIARQLASAWRAGKMLGGNPHRAAEALLGEIERLEKHAIDTAERLARLRALGERANAYFGQLLWPRRARTEAHEDPGGCTTWIE
jgi:hypothetical protein